ncbi:hypothetical protein IQ07DRAFT_585167 [Pyrenochaeta sp. DS3sAY3a]|nr:hypothetical protein IQ07DRAFT_585167 [Pyrenochaeta sp. DS3sAY3a]
MTIFNFQGLLCFLATTALGITIPPTPIWPSGRCTDKSLTIPSWLITRYKVVAGKATFVVANRAYESSSTAFIDCSPGVENCKSSAGGNEVTVKWTRGSDGRANISISHFWYCRDDGDTTVFTGTGSTVITACDGDDCVSPITYLAQGSIILPVPLTPPQPSPPQGYDNPTCATVGKKQWTVSNVVYKNYTKGQCRYWYYVDQVCIDPGPPYDGFIRRGQHLSFDITNNAIAHSVVCKYVPSYENPNLPQTLRCTGGNFNEITLDATWTGTPSNFTLKIEELWYCLENPKTNNNATVIVATGTLPLQLTCETSTGITNTTDDIVTICTDPVQSHELDGMQTEKQTLPSYALITAYPVHGGCTYDSVVNPTWYYRGMTFLTNPISPEDPDSTTLQRISAGLTGPGFKDYFFYLYQVISGTGINRKYTCTVYYDGRVREQHYNCTYTFNPFTKVITQEKTWECNDKDPKKPIYFQGSGSFDWTIDPYYTCNTPNKTLDCYWRGDTAQLQPGIPYDVPVVKATLVNVLPPDYSLGSVMQVEGQQDFNAERQRDTIREGGVWKLVNGGV